MNNLDNEQKNDSKDAVVSENERQTKDAHRLAAAQEEKDRIAGKKPVVTSVADAIKGKLEQDDFKVAVDEEGNQVAPRQIKNN